MVRTARRVNTQPDVKDKFATFGFVPSPGPVQQVVDLMQGDRTRYAEVLKRVKVSIVPRRPEPDLRRQDTARAVGTARAAVRGHRAGHRGADADGLLRRANGGHPLDEAGRREDDGGLGHRHHWHLGHPGFSLHQEFRELAAAGLSPLEVLQMTTLNGAEFLKRETTMGTVEVGKNADLVLLDANPMADVANLGRISAVFLRGKHFPRAALDQMKAAMAAAYAAQPLQSFSAISDPNHVD